MNEPMDTGTLSEVPAPQRQSFDNQDYEEPNDDEGCDVSWVEDGKVVVLSTAHLDDEPSFTPLDRGE